MDIGQCDRAQLREQGATARREGSSAHAGDIHELLKLINVLATAWRKGSGWAVGEELVGSNQPLRDRSPCYRACSSQ